MPPFLLAVAIAYILNSAIDFLVNQGFDRRLAILLIYGLVIAILASIVVYLIPSFIRELNQLTQVLPEHVVKAQDWIAKLERGYSRTPLPKSLREALDQAVSDFENQIVEAINGVVQSLAGVFSSLFSLVLAPILAYYLLCDFGRLKKKGLAFLPPSYRTEAMKLGSEIDEILSGFIRGQLLIAIIEASMVVLVMFWLELPFVFLTGIVFALAELIPYFGPVLGAVPAIANALLQSPGTAIKMGIALLVIQQVEASFLSPAIMGSNLGLHPIVVVFSLLAGAHLFGLWGLLLGVPATALLRVIGNFIIGLLMEGPKGKNGE